MKLRETDQINENGVHLGRVIEVDDDHGKAILALQESRGYAAWEKAPKNATVNATLTSPDADESAESEPVPVDSTNKEPAA